MRGWRQSTRDGINFINDKYIRAKDALFAEKKAKTEA